MTTPEAVLPSSIRLIPEIPLVPNTIKLTLLFSAYSTIAFVTEPKSQRTSVCTFTFLADASCFTSSTIFCPYCFARSKISLDFMLGGTIWSAIRSAPYFSASSEAFSAAWKKFLTHLRLPRFYG